MEEIISKQELDELMKTPGKTRGVSVSDYGEYILREKGSEGLKALEEATAALGQPINYKEIKRMGYCPVWFESLTLILVQRLFGFDDKQIYKMGRDQARVSILIRIYMKYFFSVKKTVSVVPRIWRNFYDTGELKVAELDEEKKYAVITIENFKLVPLFCQYISGYFAAVLQLVVGAGTTCQETKCLHRGDEHHEFLLKW